MTRVDQLRQVVRAHKLGELRRAEFQAILEALGPDEDVLALAPAELRGRRGFVVATARRVFFAHAGLAGTAVSPIVSAPVVPSLERDAEGTFTMIFPAGDGGEVRLDAVAAEYATVFGSRMVGEAGNGPGPR